MPDYGLSKISYGGVPIGVGRIYDAPATSEQIEQRGFRAAALYGPMFSVPLTITAQVQASRDAFEKLAAALRRLRFPRHHQRRLRYNRHARKRRLR